jgi:hypothetical protein
MRIKSSQLTGKYVKWNHQSDKKGSICHYMLHAVGNSDFPDEKNIPQMKDCQLQLCRKLQYHESYLENI